MVPRHFDPSRVGDVYRVPYEERARDALAFRDKHGVRPSARDDGSRRRADTPPTERRDGPRDTRP